MIFENTLIKSKFIQDFDWAAYLSSDRKHWNSFIVLIVTYKLRYLFSLYTVICIAFKIPVPRMTSRRGDRGPCGYTLPAFGY